MISLKAGVVINRAFAAEVKKVGKGILYVLNTDLAFEKLGEGLVWNVSFHNLASFEAVNKNKVIVVWYANVAGNTRKIRSEFKVKKVAFDVEREIAHANSEYVALIQSGDAT